MTRGAQSIETRDRGYFVKSDLVTKRPKKELFHLAAIFSKKDGNIMTVEILHRVC